jgi:hypothetical protein
MKSRPRKSDRPEKFKIVEDGFSVWQGSAEITSVAVNVNSADELYRKLCFRKDSVERMWRGGSDSIEGSRRKQKAGPRAGLPVL